MRRFPEVEEEGEAEEGRKLYAEGSGLPALDTPAEDALVAAARAAVSFDVFSADLVRQFSGAPLLRALPQAGC